MDNRRWGVKEFLADRVYLLVFYLILMVLITGIVYFDRRSRILDANLTYLLVVSGFLFLAYLLVEYYRQRSYYRRLAELKMCAERNWVNNLPEPVTLEQAWHQELLGKLYMETNQQIERFQEKSEEDLEFLTSWVHEIKTPIAVARLTIENSLNNPTEKTLYSIEEELDKIEDGVQKALYYARLNDFAHDYMINHIQMEGLVKESVKKHSKSFIGKSLKISLHDLTYEVPTDRKWMGFILDQLISNAVKYTERGGMIEIWMEDTEREMLLHVRDTGIGIRPEDLCRVFLPSFTGTNGRVAGSKATGMGLYLSRKMAQKLGHDLTITSRPQQGTVVTVHFPKWTDYFQVTRM